MKYILSLCLLFSCGFSAEVLKKEPVEKFIEAIKIKFEDHTYIHFSNTWNVAGSGWFHDPDCEKCQEKRIKK